MWDVIYPDVIASIRPKEAIYVRIRIIDIYMSRCFIDVAMFQSVQRVTEWRSSFGSGAIATLKDLWASRNIETSQGRRKFSAYMLGKGLPFIWQSFNSKTKVRHYP